MPTYACDECNKAFRSKEALREHLEQHPEDASQPTERLFSRVSNYDFSIRSLRKQLTLKNFMILGGVLMMATLFAGTAQYMSSTAPSSSSPTGAATSETNPPSGYSLRQASDLPSVRQSQIPNSQVVKSPLSRDTQLYLLARGGQNGQPGVLLQYNCPNRCPSVVNKLTAIAQDYQGWVYVAPYPDMEEKVAMTAFQRIDKRETVDPSYIENFICSSLRNRPVGCVVN